MDKHDINLNTGQVKFSNSMMGIFEDLKTNEVDPEVEALEPDVEPEVIKGVTKKMSLAQNFKV